MDSDGEREDDDDEKQNSVFKSADHQQQQTLSCTSCAGEETDGPRLKVPSLGARTNYMVVK